MAPIPEISRFYGIIIAMYYDEHNPPHFHATYNGIESVFDINETRRLYMRPTDCIDICPDTIYNGQRYYERKYRLS